MDKEEKQKFIEAGKLTAQVREYGASLIKKGASLLEVSDKIDKKIVSLGGKPAWPSQISCDSVAAHYCADDDDETVFDSQVCCMDVGVHLDGYVGDTAYTVDLSGSYSELVQAARKALDEALKIVQIGTTLGDIGKTIQDTITSYGYVPVKNLSGHGIRRFDIHTDPSVPNVATGDTTQLQKGQVIAIEPFASTGSGMVAESGQGTVFMLEGRKPVRNPITRKVLQEMESYEGVPFAKRWLTRKFGAKALFAMRELKQAGILHEFPPLVDTMKGIVAQAEHTVIIDDKCVVTTK